MPIEITASIATIVGLVIGAVVNHLLSRNKISAEIEKMRAEANKARADTEKTRAEMLAPKSTSEIATLTKDQENKLIKRVYEKIRDIQERTQNRPANTLYQPPPLSERLIYILTVRQDIENKIREIVESHGGGWAGVSMKSFDAFFEIAVTHELISEDLVREINDFYFYSQPLLFRGEVQDGQFLEIQYLAANINQQLDFVFHNINEMHQ